MQMYSDKNIMVRLLISPQLGILRHVILFGFVFSISAGAIWFGEDRGETLSLFEKLTGLFFYTSIILSACYLNIYVLTPRLLLKNKWDAHFLALFGLTLMLFALIVVFQLLSTNHDGALLVDQEINAFYYLRTTINILSTCVSFFLLFAGLSALILLKNWLLDMKQVEELEAVTLQMELKLLENQINPHFLFNMLNNANIMVKQEPETAVHIIGKLEEMLRYQMKDSIKEKVYLKDEITFLSDFLELEKTRRDYFDYTIAHDRNIDEVEVVPLLFIPFVENAVKHNQDSKAMSYVHIWFSVEKGELVFVCENSIPQHPSSQKGIGGIGLANVKRRLDLLHKGNYAIENTRTDTSYRVKLELKL